LIIISLLYFILIVWLIIGFDKIKNFENHKINTKNKFSIIIPFRNEQDNLFELINSLNNICYDYDAFEILFIDDDSTDNSVNLIKKHLSSNYDFQILKNKRRSDSPKKDAIETAINNHSSQRIGAIILASDGIYNKGINPIYTAVKSYAPIYTIGLGDTIRPKDAFVIGLKNNNIVYLNDKTELIELHIRET